MDLRGVPMRIGILDSGLGGLSVLRVLLNQLSGAHFLYLGDTAYMPYGNKSPAQLYPRVAAAAHFLLSQGADVLVIACHTASALTAESLRRKVSCPVIDMLQPTRAALLSSSRSGPVALLGTEALVRSRCYERVLSDLPRSMVAIACAPFATLVERGFASSAEGYEVVEALFKPLQAAPPETILLGCTHYFALQQQMLKILPNVEIIDPSEWVADYVVTTTHMSDDCVDASKKRSSIEGCWVTEGASAFQARSRLFLNSCIPRVDDVVLSLRQGPL
jgi:glutamate racemase